MKLKWFLLSSGCVLALIAKADSVLPILEETNSRLLSDDKVVRGEYEYKKRFDSETQKNSDIQKELDKARDALSRQSKASATQNQMDVSEPNAAGKKPVSNSGQGLQTKFLPLRVNENPSFIQNFSVTKSSEEKSVLPYGSYAKAKVMSGVEVSSQEPYPMLLQLDHAFVGPNKSKIDLRLCFVMAKVKANLAIERVIGETVEISCQRDNGEHVRKPFKGFLVGDDSSFGITGHLMSKQGQMLIKSGIAKGTGDVLGMAQNITQDYLQQAVPSIAVGSGRNVWVVMLESVELPELSTDESNEE